MFNSDSSHVSSVPLCSSVKYLHSHGQHLVLLLQGVRNMRTVSERDLSAHPCAGT